MIRKYWIILFDKFHIKLVDTTLKDIRDYPVNKCFIYFVYIQDDYGRYVPYCKIEKGIIDMSFVCTFNFSRFLLDG